MAQQIHEQWVARDNIVRFEERLKSEAGTCQRKLLEGLLVLEQEKLKAVSANQLSVVAVWKNPT